MAQYEPMSLLCRLALGEYTGWVLTVLTVLLVFPALAVKTSPLQTLILPAFRMLFCGTNCLAKKTIMSIR